ncbi:uncharacterized protein TRIADDRAFT_50291 [Trichoplax adhaerens]|uniref:GDP-Man:Man(3)GlcNAc(2)-PP-Dol alpha-1,2-mannosyltransferase n=1 Tax=Trichoplax adhaerens TaxID=10228 RepID=B3RXU1_TRIAD|nr:hypothetical protein TRIADDRAFT_50291 [Trichoplax adhaerens]EDV24914.1 hypothetical protein TRIADDRAFT_50291 [Trichoplax adhaerens]|eukprot:XP_002112804.1 hypothetical protein TRIADDRAFT_50291 [Trichoplax adhaerens]
MLVLYLRRWATRKRNQLKNNIDAKVIVGFFHPYCNAGGGGERVLWCAIRAIQEVYPGAHCVVYSGDCDAKPQDILRKVKQRFNINLKRDVEFKFLRKRQLVEASSYPFFTLLGQSLGSILLGWEALRLCVPDIYIDSMGYAFTLPLFRYIGCCSIGCYVHYPTISVDMLSVVSSRRPGFNNASFISNSKLLSSIKILYYYIFALLYGLVGSSAHVIMVNSSWTKNHILALWKKPLSTSVVYPPCDTKTFQQFPITEFPEVNDKQQLTIVSIAQFRPEKDHPLQIRSFHRFLQALSQEEKKRYGLILIGSCRNDEDLARVNKLKVLCDELKIVDYVKFELNVSFEKLQERLSNATIGLHTMWNEHFGIGVVECMAAGAVTLAHNSGGPKMDIVKDWQGQPTGLLAENEEQYATAMKEIFEMSTKERMDLRLRARESAAARFSEDVFNTSFIRAVQPLFHK